MELFGQFAQRAVPRIAAICRVGSHNLDQPHILIGFISQSVRVGRERGICDVIGVLTKTVSPHLIVVDRWHSSLLEVGLAVQQLVLHVVVRDHRVRHLAIMRRHSVIDAPCDHCRVLGDQQDDSGDADPQPCAITHLSPWPRHDRR